MNIGETIRNFRLQRSMSQGDIEKRTGLLRCFLSQMRRYSVNLNDSDRKLVLAMVKKMASSTSK